MYSYVLVPYMPPRLADQPLASCTHVSVGRASYDVRTRGERESISDIYCYACFSHEDLTKIDGRPLSALINETHENPKYLPGVQLGSNVVAEPDLLKAVEGATALVIVLPHQVSDRANESVSY
jgi:hypothetical protein